MVKFNGKITVLLYQLKKWTNHFFDIDENGSSAFIVWEDYRNGSDYDIIGREIDLSSGPTGSEIYFLLTLLINKSH